MSAYLNEVFYHKDVISSPMVGVKLLSEFMLLADDRTAVLTRVDSIIDKKDEKMEKSEGQSESENVNNNNKKNDKEDPVDRDDGFIWPRQPDTLFWCMFIIAHGYNEYMQVGRNYGVRELAEKQRVLEFIKTHRVEMKATNIRMTNIAIQEIQSELMTSQRDTSMMALVALAVYYHVNLIIVGINEKCMMEIRSSSHDDEGIPTYLIQKMAQGKYKIRPENLSRGRIETLRRGMVSLHSFEKPLAPMSAFRVADLQELYAKLGLGLSDTKKVGKAEMYRQIGEICKLD
jgi:hypothetical protein